MKFLSAKIKKVLNDSTYLIQAEIPSYGEIEAIALRFENEPLEGDEILIFLMDELFEITASYIPFKILTQDDFIGIARKGGKIEFKNDGKIEITGPFIELNADKVQVTGAKAIPNFSGSFCSLPKCLYTGVSHTIDLSTKSP